jgi:hypothetical protein
MWSVLVLLALVAVGSVQSWRERAWRRERIAGQSAVRRAIGRAPRLSKPQGRVAGTFRRMWGERKGGHRDTAAPYRLGDLFPHR